MFFKGQIAPACVCISQPQHQLMMHVSMMVLGYAFLLSGSLFLVALTVITFQNSTRMFGKNNHLLNVLFSFDEIQYMNEENNVLRNTFFFFSCVVKVFLKIVQSHYSYFFQVKVRYSCTNDSVATKVMEPKLRYLHSCLFVRSQVRSQFFFIYLYSRYLYYASLFYDKSKVFITNDKFMTHFMKYFKYMFSARISHLIHVVVILFFNKKIGALQLVSRTLDLQSLSISYKKKIINDVTKKMVVTNRQNMIYETNTKKSFIQSQK